MRRNLDPEPLPAKRCTILFRCPDCEPAWEKWWLVVEKDKVDPCLVDPGHDVDLFVTCPLRSMTSIWMGVSTVAKEAECGELKLVGNREVAKAMQEWLGLSPFARKARAAA